MRIPEKSELPLRAQPQKLEVSQDAVQLFHRAFRTHSDFIPPTFCARALKGVFDLVNSLDVDWRRLLHATQTFIYHAPLHVSQKLIAEAQLKDCRLRAGMYWLPFELLIKDDTGKLFITAKSLIMVRADDKANDANPTVSPGTPSNSDAKTIRFEEISKEQIRDYCEASGDWNRIHHDDAFAKESGLPGVIAHGMLTMGLCARAFQESGVDFSKVAQLEAKFKDIVLPGDELRAEFYSSSPFHLNLLKKSGGIVLEASVKLA